MKYFSRGSGKSGSGKRFPGPSFPATARTTIQSTPHLMLPRLILLLLFAGCGATPYVAARHISDPQIHGDGYDLACAGIKSRDRLSVKAGWCKNIRGGQLVDISIEYELFGE